MTSPRRAGLQIAALASTTLLAIALVGCTADSGGGGASDTITLIASNEAGSPRAAVLDEIVAAFKEETGITVEVEEVANDDVDAVFEAAALAGEGPDIVLHNLTPGESDWFLDGLVYDVDPFLDDWGLRDKIQPAGIDYWTQNDAVNGFPFSAFNWPLWFNMDLLGQAGITEVPKTFDELVDAAHALREAGIQPLVVGGAEWPIQNFTTWMAQQYVEPDVAGELFASGGFCANPDAVKGLDLLAELRDEGVFVDNVAGYTADQMTTAYFNGDAAMMISGSWGYTPTPPDIAAVTELAGFPVVDGGVYDLPTAYNGYNTGIFITTAAEPRLDAVEQFVKFYYEPENLQKWVVEAGEILAANADAIGETAESEFPLVAAGNKLDETVVDFLLLPDGFWPAGYDGAAVGAEFLGSTQTGAEYCQKIDELYANL